MSASNSCSQCWSYVLLWNWVMISILSYSIWCPSMNDIKLLCKNQTIKSFSSLFDSGGSLLKKQTVLFWCETPLFLSAVPQQWQSFRCFSSLQSDDEVIRRGFWDLWNWYKVDMKSDLNPFTLLIPITACTPCTHPLHISLSVHDVTKAKQCLSS